MIELGDIQNVYDEIKIDNLESEENYGNTE